MNTRIYAIERCSKLGVYSLGGHNDSIVGCYFARKSLNVSITCPFFGRYPSCEMCSLRYSGLFYKPERNAVCLGL